MSIAPSPGPGPEDKSSSDGVETCIPIASDLDIVRARQTGRTVASTLGFSSIDLALIATAISELSRNILMYAKPGQIVIRLLRNSDKQGILVIASGQGPGNRRRVAASAERVQHIRKSWTGPPRLPGVRARNARHKFS